MCKHFKLYLLKTVFRPNIEGAGGVGGGLVEDGERKGKWGEVKGKIGGGNLPASGRFKSF